MDEGSDKKLPTATFKYSAGKGNSSLKYHLERYHPVVYKAVLGPQDDCTTRKRTVDCDATKPGDATLGTFFKSVKKLKRESLKAKAFYELVTMLIVFCRLPLNIVVQPVFKAFV